MMYGKSWGWTIGMAALLVILAAVYFLSEPPGGSSAPTGNRVIPDLTAADILRIEIVRKDGTAVELERAKDPVGEYWRLPRSGGHAADAGLVQQLLYALDRFVKTGALEPGRPETAPELTGLGDPRVTVTFHHGGGMETLRFGKQPPTNTTAVFYQKPGDPKVYLAGVETFDFFNKPAAQYRAKALVRYAPYAVTRIELEYKFLVAREIGKPPVTEYEKSVLERIEQGPERGWFLTSPHREKMDDVKVQGLITELSNLEASDYQPAGDPVARGIAEPQARVALSLHGQEKPVVVYFGGTTDRERKRWVHVPGSGEVAAVDAQRYEDYLPLQRKKLRTDSIFSFTKEQVRWFEVESAGAKMLIERRENRKAGEPLPTVTWEVLHPQGLRFEAERVEAFVGSVLAQRVSDFMGQQDFKNARLDPPDVRLTVETRDGKERRFFFGLSEKNGVLIEGFLRKDGINEVFTVRPEIVKVLQRLELNFLHPEMFNVPRDKIREFTFESRVTGQLQPVYYRLKADEKTGKWTFTDPAHERSAADPERVSSLLTVMNYIKAESLIARDPEAIARHRLDERVAPATLTIRHEGGTAELYISEDKSDKPTKPIYYARFKDNPTVFQINALFVESLKRVPVKKE